jgi:Xylose isomerase-like TIM barrel
MRVSNGHAAFSRRHFLYTAPAMIAAGARTATSVAQAPIRLALAGELGITTGSFVRHLSATAEPGKLRLLDLPRIMRTELDMRVIDLMTATLPSLEPDYLRQLRDAAERENCLLTNLKMNQPGLDLGAENADDRRRSIDEYQRTIVAAEILGVRWVRPLPGPKRPDLKLLAASYRELIAFAAPRGISLLIENYGWLASDPSAIPAIISAVGQELAAQPDTGNWSDNEVRYLGLARAFPLAASCDFKARTIGPQGEHDAYDLQRCFNIGWDAGFRGPWCFEHFHDNLARLFQDLKVLRDQLRQWIAARQ